MGGPVRLHSLEPTWCPSLSSGLLPCPDAEDFLVASTGHGAHGRLAVGAPGTYLGSIFEQRDIGTTRLDSIRIEDPDFLASPHGLGDRGQGMREAEAVTQLLSISCSGEPSFVFWAG